jgi:hypothetical protein
MKLNKTPGLDGLSVEFYKCFWNHINDMIIDSYNEAFEYGELPESLKVCVIALLFKKGDRDDFANYRPISLSNIDYKILASTIANRLQKVIHKIISPEQTAYIKNRYMGENIRLLLDIMDYTKTNNEAGILLFLDFQKAFDSLDWNFIEKCLKRFGFKDGFCTWIKVIYNDPKAFIKINGFLSSTIELKKGIRQGCPLSALLFIICTEFLSLSINTNPDIKGIQFEGYGNIHEIKCTQYADDTCLFIKDIESVPVCLRTVQSFSNVSGLNLNLGKTNGLCIGSRAGDMPTFNTIKWPKTPIRYLGIYIGNNENDCQKINWTNKIEKMQKLLDSWRTRKLTIQGKILVVKSLATPQLSFSASHLPIPDGIIKVINRAVYNFLWGARDNKAVYSHSRLP